MKVIYKQLSKKFPAELLKKFYSEENPGNSKTLKQCRAILKYNTVIIGAFYKNKLIGINRALDDGVYGFMTDLIVLKDYRKQGIGRNLIKKTCDALIKRNIKVIHVSTSKKLVRLCQSAANFEYDPNEITLYLFKK